MLEAALILVTVVFAVYSQLVWKSRAIAHSAAIQTGALPYVMAMLQDPWIWTALASTALGMVSWMLILRRVELSVAYAATALIFVCVPLGAHYLFGEGLSPARLVGLALIVGGILIVARTA